MIIISDRDEKLSHQDFIERMYTSIDTSELALRVQGIALLLLHSKL